MDKYQYIVSLLLRLSFREWLSDLIYYGTLNKAPLGIKLIIIQSSFFDDSVYGRLQSLPTLPLNTLPDSDIPFLFGDSKIEYLPDGRIVLYADLVASAFFMLSRYEEMIKPECRDQHGRFLAKDSIIFQQGYGMRPLVDEWGAYIREIIRKIGVNIPEEKKGFGKIWLTHDIDVPFRFLTLKSVLKQWIKNTIGYGKPIKNSLRMFLTSENDPYNTFDKIIAKESFFQKKMGSTCVEVIYFLITGKSTKQNKYCSVKITRYQKMLKKLVKSGAVIGLHPSYEAGDNPQLLKNEVHNLSQIVDCDTVYNRFHFLKWREAEHIEYIELAGINHDFTLGYADSIGFRVGTCHPYRFINPKTKEISNVIIHPMQIMECSLDRPNYMGLDYDEALQICRQVIDTTYNFNGELVLLFHNPIWSDDNYYGKLYDELLSYIETLNVNL